MILQSPYCHVPQGTSGWKTKHLLGSRPGARDVGHCSLLSRPSLVTRPRNPARTLLLGSTAQEEDRLRRRPPSPCELRRRHPEDASEGRLSPVFVAVKTKRRTQALTFRSQSRQWPSERVLEDYHTISSFLRQGAGSIPPSATEVPPGNRSILLFSFGHRAPHRLKAPIPRQRSLQTRASPPF